MDCPNCGAYNASNSIRCRRCNELLPDADENASSDSDWGPASGPEHHWDEHFRDSQSREDAEQHDPEPEPWTTPASEPRQPSDWEIAQPSGSEPFGAERERGIPSEESAYASGGDVPNYLWPSIAATLCCCAPLGIPAIVYASRVDAFKASGDRAAAAEASNKAKTWALAAVGVALLFWVAIICTGQFGGGPSV